jgi:hypothetical protein
MEILVLILLFFTWILKYIEFGIEYLKKNTAKAKRKAQVKIVKIRNKK